MQKTLNHKKRRHKSGVLGQSGAKAPPSNVEKVLQLVRPAVFAWRVLGTAFFERLVKVLE